MAELAVVPVTNRMQQECRAYILSLLARCDAGETIAVTVIEETPHGTYYIGSTSSMSRLQSAGALLEAAMKRINQ